MTEIDHGSAIRTSAPGQSDSDHASILVSLLNMTRSLLDPYRPELHYMRGPGPKWREKHSA